MARVYALLHAVAHNSKKQISDIEAEWVKAVGPHTLALKGQLLERMTEQFIKYMRSQPAKVIPVSASSDLHGCEKCYAPHVVQIVSTFYVSVQLLMWQTTLSHILMWHRRN